MAQAFQPVQDGLFCIVGDETGFAVLQGGLVYA